MKKIMTSESVCKGHPDKICDIISDSILEEILKKDPTAHVACECVTSKDLLLITGEVSTQFNIDYEMIARNVIKDIGYTKIEWGFKYDEIDVVVNISKQSIDIDRGVSLLNDEIGAGDQGMMFGYAINETDNYMPLSFTLASNIVKKLDEVKKTILNYLGPDGKAQVSVEYIDDIPARIDSIVISNQHLDCISIDELRIDIKKYVIDEVIDSSMIDNNTKIYINPTGRFVIGGPSGDVGLTGRKIIVDTYGGYAPHGGGAFSGKDPSKVDRSGAYYARYIAKNLVAAKLCKKAMVQVSYVIGISNPVSVYIDCNNTNIIPMELIYKIVNNTFDLSVKNIINELELTKLSYSKIASYGHMGRDDLNISYEKLDKVCMINKYISNNLDINSFNECL